MTKKFVFVKSFDGEEMRYGCFPEKEREDKKDKIKGKIIWDMIKKVTKEQKKEILKTLESKDKKAIIALVRQALADGLGEDDREKNIERG